MRSANSSPGRADGANAAGAEFEQRDMGRQLPGPRLARNACNALSWRVNAKGQPMKSFPALRPLSIAAAAAALLALTYGGIAHAISSNIFQYTTAQTGYFSLSPMAFAPEGNDDAAHYTINGPFWIEKDVGALSVCMVAGLNLPDGARVTSLKAWASSDIDQAVQIRLLRANLATGTANGFAGLISHDTSQTRFAMTAAVTSGAMAIVNNEHYGYGAEVCLNSTPSRFYSARITYVYSNAGD
jgi:hypothetical protein